MGVLSVVALGLLTAACGTNETQRAATGGLTGLGVGALAGGPVGAVVGGVVGAGAGSLMPEGADQLANNAVNKEHVAASNGLQSVGMATPRSSAVASNSNAAMASSGSSMPSNVSRDTVRQVQQKLKAENLYRGRVDGIAGPLTREALVAFQQEHNLQQSASIDQQTLQALNISQSQTASNRTGRNQANQTAQSNRHNATSQSGSSTAPMMTEQQIRNQLQSEGYSDVADLHQMNDNTYGAQAAKNGTTYNLQIDAENGRIVSQQEASNTRGSGSSSTMPSQGSSTQNSSTQGSSSQGSSTMTGTESGSSTGGANSTGSATGSTGGSTTR